MNILILNFILSTAVNGKIIRRDSNRDTMIYNMARGFVKAGHTVTLLASEEFHQNCIRHRDNFTNVGCAKKLIAEFERHAS